MKIAIYVALIATVCFALLSFGVPCAMRLAGICPPPPPNAAQLRDVQKLMEMKLPPSARAVAWMHESWLGYRIFLKVEIGPSDLEALIQHSPFAAMTLSSTDRMFFAAVGGRWWTDGDKAQRFLYGKTSLPQGQQYQDRRLDMFVDMDKTNVYVVYLALVGD